jgi:NAD(P)-dependent dehydrogenase (short-subunit alcohol dehydrogenase family)
VNTPHDTESYFQGKVALITGASRGIGAAVARRLARAGVDLVINHREGRGRSGKLAEALCREVEVEGVRAIAVPADIAKKDAVEALFKKAEEEFDRLDFLVLNAARAPFKPWEKLLERDLRQLVDTNYLGNVFCMQKALDPLSRQGGAVVFLSSLGSRFVNPDYPLGSMKAAMESAVKYWAESWGDRGISVNAVCAGLVMTDSFKTIRMVNPDLENLPERFFLSPEEVAGVVQYLLGPASEVIRGQTVVADKGVSNRLIWPSPPG